MLLICAASSGENLKLAHRLADMATQRGLACEVIDLTALSLPLYSPRLDNGDEIPGFSDLHSAFQRARGYIFCAPEYNGSIPPSLTNAIAWLSRASDDFRALFNGRPAGLATHSGGGGTKVMMAMRIQLAHLGANVLGREILTNRKRELSVAAAQSILDQLSVLMADQAEAPA